MVAIADELAAGGPIPVVENVVVVGCALQLGGEFVSAFGSLIDGGEPNLVFLADGGAFVVDAGVGSVFKAQGGFRDVLLQQ